MRTDCSLPFCLEDWRFIGFSALAIMAGLTGIGWVSLRYVWCRACLHNRRSHGIRYALKRRSHTEAGNRYLGERVELVPERRQTNSTWRHWDSSGRFRGTSESTTTWYEWVGREVSVHEHFYECPDCGNQWSVIKSHR